MKVDWWKSTNDTPKKNACHHGASRVSFGGHRRDVLVQRLDVKVNDRWSLAVDLTTLEQMQWFYISRAFEMAADDRFWFM